MSTSPRNMMASSLVLVKVQSGASKVSALGGLGTPRPGARETPRFRPFKWSSLV